jgi:hypothetical protein
MWEYDSGGRNVEIEEEISTAHSFRLREMARKNEQMAEFQWRAGGYQRSQLGQRL